MAVEIPPRTFRIVTASARVIDVVVTYERDHWVGRVDGQIDGTGEDARETAIDACVRKHHIAEVRGPGELTTAEQLAALRRDVVGMLRSLCANPPGLRVIEGFEGGGDDLRAVWCAAMEKAIAEVSRG